MLEVYADQEGVEVATFYSVDEARSWLLERCEYGYMSLPMTSPFR